MTTLLQCEYRKTRKRYVILTALTITAIQIGWGLHGKYNADALKWGWLMFLYQLPLVNAIFMPMLAIVVSSRLADIEHRGVMIKQLAVITDKGKIFDAKMIYGFGIVLFCNLAGWSATILFGYSKGFAGEFPLELYARYLLFTIVPTAAIYIFQQTLSLLWKNQAVTFFAGVIGTFIGLFSMFLPQYPFLRRLLPWGYYGALSFVGMFGWTKETRMKHVYYEVMDIDRISFGILCMACAVLYIVGRKLFCRKEV